MGEHQEDVRRLLEGNERVWFHPNQRLLAVWHGGPQITIADSQTFEERDVMTVKTHDRDLSDIEDAVTVKLAGRGFDRVGRTQDNTRVTEAYL